MFSLKMATAMIPTGRGGVNTAGFDSIGYVFDPSTHLWKHGTFDQISSNVLELGGGRWRLFYDGVSPRNVVEGDLMAFRGLGQNLLHPWVVFNSIFQDVTLRQGGTFGVKEDRSGRNHYFGLRITYGPKPPGATSDPLLSQSVDGFRSIQAQGGPDIQDALIEGMADDGIGIMGFYRTVIASSGRSLTVSPDTTSSGRNEAIYPSFRIGDPVRVTSKTGFIEQAIVTAVHMSGNNVELTLDGDIAAKAGFLASNPNHNGAGYQLIRNTVRNNRARGMILRGDDGKVLNNTIDGSTIHGILFTAPEQSFGGEADYSWSVLISGNVIKNTGFATNNGDVGGIALSSGFPIEGHRNIVIRNNVFDNVSGVNLYVSAARSIQILNNAFVNPHHNEVLHTNYDVDPGALIWLTGSSDVNIAGNSVRNPGPYETGSVVRTGTTRAITSDW